MSLLSRPPDSFYCSASRRILPEIQQLAGGTFTLRFYGEPGTSYVVQASTNLVHWQPVATNQVSGLGYLEFTDTVSTNYPKRFYRIAP